jgi:ribosomal protein S18 acetylase RimI-like enzyme
MRIRPGRPTDLNELIKLEAACFEPERRDSSKVFENSLISPHQEVWLATEKQQLLGSLILRFHPHTCRIHSIAVSPIAQGKGLGKRLLAFAHSRAVEHGCSRMSLEADARNGQLLIWYQKSGYKPGKRLPHYYAKNWHGVRLSLNLNH